MKKLQFRVLYRQFLFRIADLELLSAQGDMSKLLGQFASLLIFVGMLFSFQVMGLEGRMPHEAMLVRAWRVEHSMIAATMLIVGLFAVLSWDSTFPDRRDVLVLAPLPVLGSTMFLAKAAASATALSLTVATFNALVGIALPFALAPDSTSILDLLLSPERYRAFAAYWLTMFAAGTFIFCSVLSMQGVAAQLLPRRRFLRFSAFLQMAAFTLFVCVYFLQPSIATPQGLAARENQRLLAWLPSYWFLGAFQQLNGSMHQSMLPLAQRAWTALAIAVAGTVVMYTLSYLRTLRKIVEEPDILPSSHGFRRLPRFGGSLGTAVVHFSVRTLLRSRQHRVMLAFYLGIGFAILILFMRTPRAQQMLHAANVPLIFCSLVMMCVTVVGMRVVFAVPIELRANWIFRMTQVCEVRQYLIAIRRPLFVLAVAPVWLISAAFFLSIWPWRPAVGHLVILGLWGMILAWICLHAFRKIPFTCSWLPGKSFFHMAFLAALGLLFLIGEGAAYEWHALRDANSYAWTVCALTAVAILVRWRTVALEGSDEAIVEFEEKPPPAVLGLGLHRDGVLPG